MFYKLNPDHSVEPVDDVITWAKLFQLDRQLADTSIPQEIGPPIRVSTVFLGLDHGHCEKHPLIFESMVFGGGALLDGECERYCTWEAAMAGHEQMVARVRQVLSETRVLTE
jgi:hypothetical protein